MADWIGYRWLAERYGVSPVQPFRTTSAVAGSRGIERAGNRVHQIYPASARPADSLAGHLGFALKHEGIHLEFLARLFDAAPAAEFERWIVSEPTGQYARRACFFYETLTDRRLAFPGVTAGNYVAALNPDLFLTATGFINQPRWRVRDNLPGSREYCPMVLRTEGVRRAERYDCAGHLADLEVEFGAEVLQRSAVWMTVKESRASFAIEHEEQHAGRVQRFAAVMERRCGQNDDPLSQVALAELQAQILGPHATRYGLRRSPVFVGEVDGFTEVVHYIAPHWDDAPRLLAGLRDFAARTAGGCPLPRAAVCSFGFVFIHPMSDGNGRISRFLVNDVLRRDGAVPAPLILPISATITSSPGKRRGYDEMLELFSRPLMTRYADAWRFGPDMVTEDGVRYNLQFDAYRDALPTWRYPDLTEHVEYLGEVVEATVEREMPKEASYLRSLRLARARLKRVIEGSDNELDRIIKSVRESDGQLSNRLRREFALLTDEALAEQVVAAVQGAFTPP